MTNYTKGRRYEYKSRDWLLQRGYHTVLRMAGSHGPVDLVALSTVEMALVQVKSGPQGFQKVPVGPLRALGSKIPRQVTIYTHYWPTGASEPIVEQVD